MATVECQMRKNSDLFTRSNTAANRLKSALDLEGDNDDKFKCQGKT